jgi:hypothetical protein
MNPICPYQTYPMKYGRVTLYFLILHPPKLMFKNLIIFGLTGGVPLKRTMFSVMRPTPVTFETGSKHKNLSSMTEVSLEVLSRKREVEKEKRPNKPKVRKSSVL